VSQTLHTFSGLSFAALGGLGEIGMNASLYGFGSGNDRKWILVDCGISFAGDTIPGIDVIMPSLKFLEKERKNLLGLFITHAHEDHIGALSDLWDDLKVPVYATPFTIGLYETRHREGARKSTIPFRCVHQGERVSLSPFSVEFIPVSHSIPEASALAIETPAGVVLHTGDWKRDPTPTLGLPTDETRLRALGDKGILALVCDSTNILREGESVSESVVHDSLVKIIGEQKGRVAVTSFASNVARLRSVAKAAEAVGRSIVIVGQAMERALSVAQERGYLEGCKPFLDLQTGRRLEPTKTLLLMTGSQGEKRAALARLANDTKAEKLLNRGDTVIFSSRTIPGNEKAVGTIINHLIDQGIKVLTDRTHLVHTSGHPRQGELMALYQWTRPQILIPVHGEALHLSEHAAFGRHHGIPHVIEARNGDLVLLDEDSPRIGGKITSGIMYKDGSILIPEDDQAITQRRHLAWGGVVSVSLIFDRKGALLTDPLMKISGLPQMTEDGEFLRDIVEDSVFDAVKSLSKAECRDLPLVEKFVRKALCRDLEQLWRKAPTCHILVESI
jgi:ribonuclease J